MYVSRRPKRYQPARVGPHKTNSYKHFQTGCLVCLMISSTPAPPDHAAPDQDIATQGTQKTDCSSKTPTYWLQWRRTKLCHAPYSDRMPSKLCDEKISHRRYRRIHDVPTCRIDSLGEL